MTQISAQTVKRLPQYLNYLKTRPGNGPMNISARQIADALGLGEIQVRKDLSAVSACGKPRIGYLIEDLIADISAFLGLGKNCDAVLVGAGNLGSALMYYPGFAELGVRIAAAFDTHPVHEGVLQASGLAEWCSVHQPSVGIIAVPASEAQSVCDELVGFGVQALWNFAPTHLRVPGGVVLKNEDLAASLAVLMQSVAR